jgi:hypothetical protein
MEKSKHILISNHLTSFSLYLYALPVTYDSHSREMAQNP